MQTREWHAWLNLQPPPPDDLHVIGQVHVGNPGVLAVLTERIPSGLNPAILMLDLSLVQRPGFWPQIMTWTQARFSKEYEPGGDRPSRVDIFDASSGERITSVDVRVVQ